MASPGTEPEAMLARATAVSLALHALVERLVQAGVLTPKDLVEMQRFGLELAAGIRAHGSTVAHELAARLDLEIISWWAAAGVPDGNANDP